METGTGDPEFWRSLRSALERGCSSLGPKDRVDDAVQESLLSLVVALRAGAVIADAAGWCAVIVRRRVVDSQRRIRRLVLGQDLDRLVRLAEPTGDWVALLRSEWVEVSAADSDLLRRIQAGCRGHGSLARALGRNVKTIRERRLRLQALLRRVLEDIGGVPPPLYQGRATRGLLVDSGGPAACREQPFAP